jgi:hypothetical protein
MYQKDAGVGTVVAMMLPCAAVLYVVWLVFLIIWYLMGFRSSFDAWQRRYSIMVRGGRAGRLLTWQEPTMAHLGHAA